jgi:dCMP deaminase
MTRTDQNFIELAGNVGNTLSTCIRRKVGALIVDDEQVVIAIGWNHSEPSCWHQVGCNRVGEEPGQALEKCRSIHAEVDAIKKATRLCAKLVDATMYVTTYPCHACAKEIAESGITRVVYRDEYPSDGSRIFEEKGIKVEKVSKAKWHPCVDRR